MSKEMANNNNNGGGIYGNPFSYLTPVGKEPLRSSKHSDKHVSETDEPLEEKQPFSYLTTSPSDKHVKPPSASEDDVFDKSEPPAKTFDFDSLYQPPPANHLVGSNQNLTRNGLGASFNNNNRNNLNSSGGSGSGSSGGYQGMSNPAYVKEELPSSYTELGHIKTSNDGGIPDGGGFVYSGEYFNPANEHFQAPNPNPNIRQQSPIPHSPIPTTPTSPGIRPLTRESAMNSSYRANRAAVEEGRGWGGTGGKGKGGCKTGCWIFALVLVGLVALGVGFAAGWFVQRNVMPALSPASTSQAAVTTTLSAAASFGTSSTTLGISATTTTEANVLIANATTSTPDNNSTPLPPIVTNTTPMPATEVTTTEAGIPTPAPPTTTITAASLSSTRTTTTSPTTITT